MATLCILLSLAFGVASVASYFFVDGQNFEKRVDAAAVTVLLASGALLSFVLAIWFALYAVATA